MIFILLSDDFTMRNFSIPASSFYMVGVSSLFYPFRYRRQENGQTVFNTQTGAYFGPWIWPCDNTSDDNFVDVRILSDFVKKITYFLSTNQTGLHESLNKSLTLKFSHPRLAF